MKKSLSILSTLYVVFGIAIIPVGSEPLQAKIEVSTELPAVPRELRVGVVFDEANLPAMGTNQDWRWIPSWYAGTWHRETQTNLLPTGPQTVLSRSVNEVQFGDQMDSRGGIWNHVSLPKVTIIEAANVTEWQVFTDGQSILANEEQIVRRYRYMAIDVNKRNNKIVKVLQKEEFCVLRPEGQGKIFQDTGLTVYDEFGQRVSSFAVQAHWYQLYPFKPIAIDPKTKLDLRQDFKKYLLSHGLADLVPVDDAPVQDNKTIDKH